MTPADEAIVLHMYFLRRRILRPLFKILRKSPDDMPMVQYWKYKDAVAAKITKDKEGAVIMYMEGEREPIRGFPRGHLLFGTLSRLKHEIKNGIFNESWRKLEEGKSRRQVIEEIKQCLFTEITALTEQIKYDMVPPERMGGPVREIWRAWTRVEEDMTPREREKSAFIKKALTFIWQEDDSYRFRLQWMIQIFNPAAWWAIGRDPIREFDAAFRELEHGEIVGDMKERVRLWRRIIMLTLEDPVIKKHFLNLCKELKWNKLRLSKGDKYHFRGKYFKVDLDRFEY